MLEIKLPINPIVPGKIIIIQQPETIKEKSIPPNRDLKTAYEYLLDTFFKKQSVPQYQNANVQIIISSWRCLNQEQRLERITHILPSLQKFMKGIKIIELVVTSLINKRDMGIIIKIEEVKSDSTTNTGPKQAV